MRFIFFPLGLLTICFPFSGSISAQSKTALNPDPIIAELSQTPPLDGTNADTIRIMLANEVGIVYEKMKMLDSALFYYFLVADTVISEEKVLRFKERSVINSLLLNDLMTVLLRKREFDQALAICRINFKINALLANQAEMANQMNSIGTIWFYQRDFVQAGECYEQAFTMFSDLAKSTSETERQAGVRGASRLYYNLGLVFRKQGNNRKAAEYYMKALDIKEENKDEKGISNCLNALGAVNKAMGEYPKAEQYYKKCLLIRESLNDSVGIADLYNNMCTLYKSQGNYKKALSYGQKGLELVKVFDNSDDPDRLISLYSNMGILYHFLGEDSLSEMYFQYSLDEAIKSIDSISIATGYTHFGVNYCESNNFQAADSNYRKAMEILEKFPNKRAFSTLYNNMGDLAAVQGKDIEALEWYKKSISLKQELNERANLANYYPSLAKAYLRTGDKLQCREILVKSMKMQRKLLKENFSVLSESEKAMFLKQATIVFEKFNDFALAHAEETDTLQGLCYNNSLLLNGLLLNSTREILEAAENNQDSTMKLAFWQLKQLREEISNLQSMPADKKEGNLENLELRANALEEELVRKSVSFARLYRQFDFQWTDVQKVLGQGEVAIEFVKIRHAMILQESLKADSFSYAALIIRPGMKTPAFVPLCSSNELAQLTDRSSTDDLRYVDRVYDPQGETLLYNLIWKPMENQLKDAKTVYFAPAGMLHQVSFAGIPVSGGKLLSDKFSLQRVSGTSVLLEGERNDKIKVKNALIYGGIDFTGFPEEIRNTVSSGDGFTWQFLEASLVEASVIEKILKKSGTNVSFLSGKKASEESFRAASGNSAPDVIHFATHGFTFPDPEKGSEDLLFENSFVMNLDPLFRTGLLFAGANLTWNGRHVPEGKEDGVLTAFEVANQNLRNTRLVVMSACETGMGHISGSEGVYGLQRAFKMAGVKYIVMSLWAVPDEQTAELMSLFYSKLASGETIRKSFVAAQNEMKKKYAAYFWAGFVLIE